MRILIAHQHFFLKCVIASILALTVCSVFLYPASAWTHENNNFDNNSTQYQCGGSRQFPCLYWQQPHNTSINLYFRVDSSLLPQNGPHGSFNWLSTINSAFSNYNSIVAWNPYMYTCTTGVFCEDNSVGVYTTDNDGNPRWQCDLFNGFLLGLTLYTWSTVEYAGGQYYAFFGSTHTEFNHIIHWNTSKNWSGDCSSGINGDAAYVARHETGHVIGLGHTAHTAIMRQVSLGSPPNFDTLQSDDIQGVQTIYDGNNPTS
jgi:hypothetical protein